jgi:hypothetical protein
MSTLDVAAELRTPTWRLHALILKHLIPRPAKNAAGEYTWSPADVQCARTVLPRIRRGRPRTREVSHAAS